MLGKHNMTKVQKGDSETLREEATIFLQERLLDHLSPFTYYITGSYALDVMAWPDIDLNVLYVDRLVSNIYSLGSNLLASLNPSWLELRNASAEPDTPGHFFLGFETTIGKNLWNVDIWFQSQRVYAENHSWLLTTKKEINKSQKSAIVHIKHPGHQGYPRNKIKFLIMFFRMPCLALGNNPKRYSSFHRWTSTFSSTVAYNFPGALGGDDAPRDPFNGAVFLPTDTFSYIQADRFNMSRIAAHPMELATLLIAFLASDFSPAWWGFIQLGQGGHSSPTPQRLRRTLESSEGGSEQVLAHYSVVLLADSVPKQCPTRLSWNFSRD